MSQPLEKVLALTNINDITEMVSTYLKKPVVVENDQFSLLAYSSYYIEQFDEANQQTIFTKRWPIPILEKFMEEGVVEQLKTIPGPFHVPPIKDIGLNPRVVVSAKYKEQIFGYIWVQETTPPLTDTQMDFLQKVSVHVGRLLYKENQVKARKDEKKNQFYKKIIDETYRTENQIKWEAANVNVVLPTSFLVTVFMVAQIDEDIFEELTETIRLFVNALNRPAHLFTDELKIIVIIGSNSPASSSLTESADQLTNTILSQYKPQTVYVGIGSEYTSIVDLRQSYLEALRVIHTAEFLGTSSLPAFHYKKMGVFRYLEAIARFNSETDYVNEDLLKLERKDQESQSNLLETLEAYLLNHCRIKPAAEQLFIHTNTLKYRLKQIADLTTIDFNDFNMNAQLFIDLQLMKRKKQAPDR
ncbi:PucR family transcriptional regulator [Pseudobacillus sp. 179-B 2D1 NHS]|uniref:PucR family transcriptional regulator n=1 Tax=Pseudobacillus sp. 179-B 2D1 NHS TaxID=3374292 RepID=UPI00387990EE